MADLSVTTGKRGRHIPRIDLTPMVDLGFLLISFFMMTTTLAKPKTMELNMPAPTTGNPTAFIEEATITIIPIAHHKALYYFGAPSATTSPLTKTIPALRQILQAKQRQIAMLPSTYSKEAHLLHVIIKPTNACTYADVVNILDEMNILSIPYYAITDLSPEETQLLTQQNP